MKQTMVFVLKTPHTLHIHIMGTCLILFTLVSFPAGAVAILLSDGYNWYLMHRHASSAQDYGIPRYLQPTKDNRLTSSCGSAWKQRIWPTPELVSTLLKTHAWNQVSWLRSQTSAATEGNIQRAGRHIPPKKSLSQPLSFYLCDLWQGERETDRKSSFKCYSTWELQWCLSLWICVCARLLTWPVNMLLRGLRGYFSSKSPPSRSSVGWSCELISLQPQGLHKTSATVTHKHTRSHEHGKTHRTEQTSC